MTTRILLPGTTCAAVFEDSRGGVLVDGSDFYRALYDALCQAEHTVLMAGWQFSSGVELVRGPGAGTGNHPTTLIHLLTELCKNRPDLRIYMLPWDSSPVFTFEREPLQRLRFRLNGHPRIHWHMDSCHPPGASHHQKLIVVDRAIAFVGGMDVCDSRWDDRAHAAHSKQRCGPLGTYAPYHDVQAYLAGREAVGVLEALFWERWEHAGGERPAAAPLPEPSRVIEPRTIPANLALAG